MPMPLPIVCFSKMAWGQELNPVKKKSWKSNQGNGEKIVESANTIISMLSFINLSDG